jgi:short-subunit dehydrogenase
MPPEHAPSHTPVRSPRGHGRRQLAGLRAIVTGASSGVGRATALELHRRGVHVLATARRAERLTALSESADAGGPPLLHEAGDITGDGFRRRLVAAAVERLGGVDLVVAAAGSGAIGSFRDGSPETLARILDVDLIAPIELSRLCLPELLRGRDPCIAFVGSILAYHPLPLHADYCAAKSGLRAYAGAIRLELADDGVDVLLASLGPTVSEFWDSLLAGSRPSWSRGTPLPSERAAALIVRALEERRAELLPDWRARGFAWAARFAPGLIDAVTSRGLRRDRDSGHASSGKPPS